MGSPSAHVLVHEHTSVTAKRLLKISYFLLHRTLSVYMFSLSLLAVGIIENHTPSGTCTVHPGGVHSTVHLQYAFIFSLKQQLMDIVTSLCQAKSFKLHSFPTKITQNMPTFTHNFTCQRTTIFFAFIYARTPNNSLLPSQISIRIMSVQTLHTSISLIKKQSDP